MNINYPNILPECFIDTNLIQYLMHGTVNHQHSCNKVIGNMKDKLLDCFAIGIIDRDKVEVGYLADCDEVAKTNHLIVWKHRRLPHFLVTVKPAIERFLLDCAKEQKVNPEDFGLPHQPKLFIKQAKKVTSNKDPKIRSLIIAIKNNVEIQNLEQTLHYLKNKNYNFDIEEVKRLMGNA